MGYLVGARDLDGANECNKRSLKLFCPITVGIAAVLWVIATPLYGIFSSDERVLALGAQIMAVEVFFRGGTFV